MPSGSKPEPACAPGVKSVPSMAVVVMGVSGCGKTSVGKALALQVAGRFIEGDELHPAENIRKMSAGIPLDDTDRWPWLTSIGDEIATALAANMNVVASCSSLKRSYRDHLRAHIGERLRFVFLQASPEELQSRMRTRSNHFMPVSLLASQFAALEIPFGEPDVIWLNANQPLHGIMSELADFSQ